MEAADWPAVSEIYREGIETGIATFETGVPRRDQWNRAHLPHPRLVAEDDRLIGWAALSPVSERCVYEGVAEVSIYVAGDSRGRGAGTKLLGRLIRSSENNGIWTLQAGIFTENTGSTRLHRKCGFREVGVRERLGALGGQW